MTSQDLVRGRSKRNSAAPATTASVSRTMREQQYLYLVRLAWSLYRRGLRVTVDLSLKSEPVLIAPRTGAASLRVMVCRTKGIWIYTWGRGDSQRVRVLADDAADRIWEVAQ
ncbi:hypothetical protein [Sphaerisporangium aureirubrum]|uniref:Uncharacterized protein n=1 Tax=Sphaerisporangium aureirubrum TaxID=1544736 RepID=A0ABW1NIN8_9ACTN